jgi:hypothetical protein
VMVEVFLIRFLQFRGSKWFEYEDVGSSLQKDGCVVKACSHQNNGDWGNAKR